MSTIANLVIAASVDASGVLSGMTAAQRVIEERIRAVEALSKATVGADASAISAAKTRIDAEIKLLAITRGTTEQYQRLEAAMKQLSTTAAQTTAAVERVGTGMTTLGRRSASTGLMVGFALEGMASGHEGMARRALRSVALLGFAFGPEVGGITSIIAIAAMAMYDYFHKVEAAAKKAAAEFKKSMAEMTNTADWQGMETRLEAIQFGTPANRFKDGIKGMEEERKRLNSVLNAVNAGPMLTDHARRRQTSEAAPIAAAITALDARIALARAEEKTLTAALLNPPQLRRPITGLNTVVTDPTVGGAAAKKALQERIELLQRTHSIELSNLAEIRERRARERDDLVTLAQLNQNTADRVKEQAVWLERAKKTLADMVALAGRMPIGPQRAGLEANAAALRKGIESAADDRNEVEKTAHVVVERFDMLRRMAGNQGEQFISDAQSLFDTILASVGGDMTKLSERLAKALEELHKRIMQAAADAVRARAYAEPAGLSRAAMLEEARANAAKREGTASFQTQVANINRAADVKSSFGGLDGIKEAGQILKGVGLDVALAFGPVALLMKALQPALTLLDQLATDFVAPLSAIFVLAAQSLVPMLKLLFPIIKGAAIVLTYWIQIVSTVTAAFARLIGNIVHAVGHMIAQIPFLGGFGSAIEHAGDALLRYADGEDQIAKAAAQTRKQIEALGFGAAAATGALLNVPAGYKIALARFEAITGRNGPLLPLPAPPSTPQTPVGPNTSRSGASAAPQLTQTFTAGSIVIAGANKSTAQLFAEIKAYAQTKARAQFGTTALASTLLDR